MHSPVSSCEQILNAFESSLNKYGKTYYCGVGKKICMQVTGCFTNCKYLTLEVWRNNLKQNKTSLEFMTYLLLTLLL